MRNFIRAIVILPAVFSFLMSQDPEAEFSLVILSPRVGGTIDAAEREQFQLLTYVQNFDSASVYYAAQGGYFVRLYQSTPDGASEATSTTVRKEFVEMLSDKIEHMELISDGTYQLGQDPVVLRYVRLSSSEQPPRLTEQRAAIGELPLSPAVSQYLMETYPILGITFGVSTYSPDVNGLTGGLGERNENPSLSPLFWIGFRLRAIEYVGATIHGGISPEGSMIAAMLDLQMPVPTIPWLRPYLSGGWAHSKFMHEFTGGIISLGARKGMILGAGIEAMTSRRFSVSGGAQYFFSKTLSTDFEGTPMSINLSGLMVILKGTLYL